MPDTAPIRRKAEYTESTRQALLSAAKEAFATHGFLATSIDDIADIARVSKGALYHHFKDKQAVFDAVVVGLEDAMAIYVEQQVQLEGSAERRFETGLRSYLTACTDPTFQTACYPGRAVGARHATLPRNRRGCRRPTDGRTAACHAESRGDRLRRCSLSRTHFGRDDVGIGLAFAQSA